MNQENTTLREIRMPVSQLKPGMYVCRLDKPWTESPFLFQGFLIEDETLIHQLTCECEYVYIDEAKQDEKIIQLAASKEKSSFSLKSLFGLKETTAHSTEIKREKTHSLKDIVEQKVATETIKPPAKLMPFDKEMGFAKQTHAKIDSLMQEFTTQVKEGGAVDILIARQAIYDCMASVLRSPDAMLLVTRLKNKHKSVWQRSMNDCVLAISLGRYLNLNDADLVTVGMSALLHDIGNLKISKQDLEQAENKKELIQSHTRLGYDILINCPGVLGEIVADVAYSHHEQLDGFGFPRGLHGEQISPYTRMISIVDKYNSLTADTSAKEGLTHYEAITLMLKKANTCFDETLLNSFNHCIGTYPIGCVVEMNTGEIALVVEINQEQRLRPKVLLLTTADKKSCPRQVLNLADMRVKDGGSFSIKAIVRPEKYGIQL
jgi:HD-GYP domain-containing protein (c-di-GMP phosphodiesterase class II)